MIVCGITSQKGIDHLLVRGRGIVFHRYYQGVAKRAVKDFRDGEKVTSTRARKQALVA